MTCRRLMKYALLAFVCLTGAASAQAGDRYLDLKARVLDVLFPLDVAQRPYFLKMILRFRDSDTQFVVVVYPDKDKYWVRRCEITSYALDSTNKEELSQLISKMIAENPQVKEQEIAAKLKVNISRSSVAPDALNQALSELKSVRISPVLADRVAVDEYSEYEFWYDNWQESVHYMLDGPFKDTPQDQLVQWMIRFRASLPTLVKSSHRG